MIVRITRECTENRRWVPATICQLVPMSIPTPVPTNQVPTPGELKISEPEAKKNGGKSLLEQFIGGGDQSIKLITLALVAISGGGNFFATKQAERVTSEDAEKAVKEIHELHEQLFDTINRQKDMLEILKKLNHQS